MYNKTLTKFHIEMFYKKIANMLKELPTLLLKFFYPFRPKFS